MRRVTSRGPSVEHLAAIDARTWPGVAAVPALTAGSARARVAESRFARAAAAGGLRIDGSDPDLVVDHAEVFTRIAAGGWIGLAEGYLAGEWRTETSESLVRVLEALIGAKYAPRTTKLPPAGSGARGELPAALVAHFSGDGVSAFQGHFATGVPTKERRMVKSFVPGAGKGNVPARHYVDTTEYGAPLDTTRLDLADAQARSAEMLLDAADVGSATHVLVAPAAGGAITTAAAQRGATVDCVAADAEAARALREHLVFAGVHEHVRVDVRDPLASAGGTGYNAAVSAEYLETLAPQDQAAYLRALDRALAPGGRLAMQTVVATGAMSKAGQAALASLRAYVWPGLSVTTLEGIAKLIDTHTGLRVVAHTSAPDHLAESLKLQRATFDAHLRDAAADGFDPVFRRLWTWQLALREALTRLGMLDLAQVEATTRSRGGRR